MYIVYSKSNEDLAWNEHTHSLRLGLHEIESYSPSFSWENLLWFKNYVHPLV